MLAWGVADSAGAREAARDDHFTHVGHIVDRIAVAGPLKNADGTNIGSMFVFEVSSVAEAEALLLADPYHAAGVWGRWTIHPFLAAAGEWVGGTIL